MTLDIRLQGLFGASGLKQGVISEGLPRLRSCEYELRGKQMLLRNQIQEVGHRIPVRSLPDRQSIVK